MQCDGMHLFLCSVLLSIAVTAACGLSMLMRPVKTQAGCPLPVKARGRRFVPNIWHLSVRGADFIHQCRRQYGDTFVLDLVFRQITFAFHPKALVKILSSSEDKVAFRPAVEDFTQRVFHLPSSQFFPQHHRLLLSLRGLLTPNKSCDHAVILLERYRQHLVEHLTGPQQVDLMPFVKSYVFPAAVIALFGLPFWQRHMKDGLQVAFFQFEENFELAASPVPHCLQPVFTRARARLLAALRASLEAGDFECTAVGELMRQCPMPDAVMPNMLLAVLWASLANTVPGTFWALAFLLLPQHAAHLAAVQASLSSGAPEHARPARDDTDSLLQVACNPGMLLAHCVAEALRLRAPGLDVRMAAADLDVPSAGPWGHGERMVRIPRGTVVAWSPYEMHLDARVFGPGAARYDPHRPGMASISGVSGIGGAAGLAFGGGKYRCPGRHFAGVEMALAIAVLLHTHDVELVQMPPGVHSPGYPGDEYGLLPAPELRRQVGIRWPKSSCLVSIRPKV